MAELSPTTASPGSRSPGSAKMFSPKAQRTADAGVRAAVEQVQKHQKFRRMMVFGLRSLSDLCLPPNNRYKENALAALDMGIVADISSAIQADAADAELAGLSSSTLWAIVEALKDPYPGRDERLKRFTDEGGVEAIVAIVKAIGPKSELQLDKTLDCLQSLAAIGALSNPGPAIDALSKAIETAPKTIPAVVTVMSHLASSSPDAAKYMALNKTTIPAMLKAVSVEASTANQVSEPIVAAALKCVERAAASRERLPEDSLPLTIDLLDRFRGNATVSHIGSGAMARLMGPEQLQKCLTQLSSAPDGSQERKNALLLLASLSYIGSYAAAIMRDKSALNTLCDTVKRAAADVQRNPTDKAVTGGFAGACKMLTTCAADPSHLPHVKVAAPALCSAVSATAGAPPALAACCLTLAAMSADVDIAIGAVNTLPVILKALHTYRSNGELAEAVSALVAAIASHGTPTEKQLAEHQDVLRILPEAMKADKENPALARNGIAALAQTVRTASDGLIAKDAVDAILEILDVHKTDIKIAEDAALFYANLVKLPKAAQIAVDGRIVESTLALLLKAKSAAAKQRCIEVLEAVATEHDVTRTLAGLEAALRAGRSQPEKAFRALAAVAGLSQVRRLGAAFERENVQGAVVEGISRWVNDVPFNQQRELIAAGTTCLEQLAGTTSGSLAPVIKALLTAMLSPKLRALIDKQDLLDNNALDLIKAAETLAELQRVESEALTDTIDAALKVMRKFPESRRCQVSCMAILCELAMVSGGPIALSETGALKHVLAYMQKVSIYDDVQMLGFKLLHLCLSAEPSLAESLKRNGAIEAIKKASRAHGKSKSVKQYLAPVAAILMPEDELEQQIIENLKAIEAAPRDNPSMCLQNIHALTQLTVSPPGIRCALRHNAAHVFSDLVISSANVRRKKPADAEFTAEISLALKNLTETRAGCLALVQAGGIEAATICIGDLQQLPPSQEKRDGLLNATYLLRSILQNDRLEAGDIVYKKGARERLSAIMAEYEEDDTVLYGAACGAIAAIRSTEFRKSADFGRFVAKLVEGISSDNSVKRIACIEALGDLLDRPEPELIDLLSKHRCTHVLFKALDDYGDDPHFRQRALQCLDEITRHQNARQAFRKADPQASLATAINVTKKTLKRCRAHPGDAAMSISTLKKLATPQDAEAIKGSGILDAVHELLELHPDHQPLRVAIGDLITLLGPDEILSDIFKQIIDTVKQNPPNLNRRLKDLCGRANLFLSADVRDPMKALALAPTAMNALADAMLKMQPEQRVEVGASAAGLARKLVEKYNEGELATKLGPGAVQPKLLPEIARLLGEGDPRSMACRNKRLVCDGFKTLAETLRNPWSRPRALEVAKAQNLAKRAEELLQIYANDPETTARLLDFLAAMALDKDGTEQVLVASAAVYKKPKSPVQNLVAEATALMNRHRRNVGVVEAGMELISNLLKNTDGACATELAKDGLLRNLAGIEDASPEALAASIKVRGRLIGKLSHDEANVELKKIFVKFEKSREDHTLTAAQHALVAGAMAKMLGDIADANMIDELKKTQAADLVPKLLEDAVAAASAAGAGTGAVTLAESAGPLAAVGAILKNTRKLAKDSDMSAKLTRGIAGVALADTAAVCGADPMAMSELIQTLRVLAESGEGNGRLIGAATAYKNLVDQVQLMTTEVPQREAEELKNELGKLVKAIQNDTPEVLTLEKVHEKWMARKEAGETMNMNEAAAILSQFDFVSDYTEEYSKEAHKSLETELGREFMFGCRCFQLLHAEAENSKPCVEKKEPAFMLKAIKKQKNEFVCQCACEASADALQYTPLVEAYIATPEAALIAADALRRGRSIPNTTPQERQAMLIPRLLIVERMATERLFFNNTDAMLALIGLWDDYDKNLFDTVLLRHVFRAMRQIVNDHFVPIILKNEVPRRLIEVVNDKNADLELLPDVLFLLGTLAVVPQIKTLIGDLKGVEACLDLLRRCLKNPAHTSRVQTNSCLALANMTIGHGPNINRFTMAKGQDLNVEVMQRSMERSVEYDIANGASILMCNTCFKRDDQKELYGKKGAPQSVMHTIKRYDGSEDKAAIRCLNSMFKAIGNLALYTPNVDEFLAHHIEQTLDHFYVNCENLPDALIESSLRTVANLVMENTEAAMKRFGKLVVPLVNMLQQGNRTTVSMLAMSFDTLGCLCRLPENARVFASNQGIPTVLKILNSESDEALYANGVFVLGIQSTNPSSVDILVENGVFNFLVSLFEQQLEKTPSGDATETDNPEGSAAPAMTTDLVVSALRCAKRLMFTASAATEFVAAGGLNALCRICTRTDEHSMVHLETYRNLISLLAHFPPPPPPEPVATTGGTEWDAVVPDEGVLPAAALASRPPSPRSWESVGFTPEQVSNVIRAICTVLTKEENSKQQRLAQMGLGLLAYFACEKIEGVVESFYNANIAKPIEILICSFESNPDISQMCCYILNNVAFASDQSMYALLRREKKMRSNLDYAVKALSKADKKVRDFCTLTCKLINEKSLDPARFEIHQQWDFPLKMSGFDKDPYPNGVQDLPLDMREEIRAGGKLKVCIDEKTREVFHWKGSFDMLALQWRIDPREGPHTHTLPIARLKTVAKGFATKEFQRIAAKTNPVHRGNV